MSLKNTWLHVDAVNFKIHVVLMCNDCRPLWLQLVFDMLVLQKHNTEMAVAAGEALYTLVCLHQVRKCISV